MSTANIATELMDRGPFTFNGIGLDCNFRHIMEALEGEEYTMKDGFEVVYSGSVDVAAKVEAAKTKEENILYQKFRAVEYPKLEDQLDYIYHNGITKWKSDMIKPVKDKYPKE
jgi:hypothetical protein